MQNILNVTANRIKLVEWCLFQRFCRELVAEALKFPGRRPKEEEGDPSSGSPTEQGEKDGKRRRTKEGAGGEKASAAWESRSNREVRAGRP